MSRDTQQLDDIDALEPFRVEKERPGKCGICSQNGAALCSFVPWFHFWPVELLGQSHSWVSVAWWYVIRKLSGECSIF